MSSRRKYFYTTQWVPLSTPQNMITPKIAYSDNSRCCSHVGNEPAPAPGINWVISWTLVLETAVETPTSKDKIFEEKVLECTKVPQEKPVTKMIR